MTAEEWFGVLLPARTPALVVETLHRAVVAAAGAPELQEALARLESGRPRAPRRRSWGRIRAELERWGPIVREAGFKPAD